MDTELVCARCGSGVSYEVQQRQFLGEPAPRTMRMPVACLNPACLNHDPAYTGVLGWTAPREEYLERIASNEATP